MSLGGAFPFDPKAVVGRCPTTPATPMQRTTSVPAVDNITLDRDTFKALASDTRLLVLKALDERQKTVTELSKQLELNKSTLLEHLEKLEGAGLVQKVEQDVERKWVYWQLTWKGRRILHPESIKVALLLSTAVGSIAAGIAALWLWTRSGVAPEGPADDARTMMAPAEGASVEEPAVALDPVYLAVAIAFGLLALAATAWAVRTRLKARAQAPRA